MADTSMKDILSEMARGLAGTYIVMVSDSDGMLLASWESPENKIAPESLGGFIQIINGSINAFKQSAVGFTKLEDVTYTTPFTYMLAKPIADGACFLFISAPRTVPLGMIRMACANFAPKLEQSLPGRETSPRRDGMGTIVP